MDSGVHLGRCRHSVTSCRCSCCSLRPAVGHHGGSALDGEAAALPPPLPPHPPFWVVGHPPRPLGRRSTSQHHIAGKLCRFPHQRRGPPAIVSITRPVKPTPLSPWTASLDLKTTEDENDRRLATLHLPGGMRQASSNC